MATLAVRALRARDLVRLRTIGPRSDRLESPLCRFRSSTAVASQLLAAVPGLPGNEHSFVATVDGELCAYLVAQEQPRRYQWELVEIAAGSPRLDATDEVCIELWTALIEFAIQQAGSSGAKRIFASVRAGSPAFESLRSNGFGAYEDRLVLTGAVDPMSELGAPAGLRKQADSDVWSIHQLYHQITPRAVQFAEALTSSEWDLDHRPWWYRVSMGMSHQSSFVLEGDEGVSGHCRIERKHGRAMASFMLAPQCANCAAELLLACARFSGVGPNDIFQVVVPGYAIEHVASLERFGFQITWERTGMVKHTTARVIVRPRLMPVPATEERERAIRGAPTLYQGR